MSMTFYDTESVEEIKYLLFSVFFEISRNDVCKCTFDEGEGLVSRIRVEVPDFTFDLASF